MGKKLTIFIVAVVVFIIMVAAFTTIVYLNYKKDKEKKEQEINPPPMVEALIKGMDMTLKNYTDSNYALEYDGIRVSEGILTKDAWTSVKIPQNHTYHLYCWQPLKYYTTMGAYLVSMEKQVKMECRDYRIGNLTISHEGKLKGKLSKVTLNIHADGQFRNLYACWSWSTGILDVTVPSQTAFCDGDSWKNYTTYYAENKSYEYLPKWVYTCRGEKEEICIAVDGDVCYLPQIEPPQRLKGLVDRCMYSGKNLENNNLSIELTIKAMDAMNILDFVKITIFDAEMRKVDDTTEWKYVTELNGEDVGAPDYVYEIPVEG